MSFKDRARFDLQPFVQEILAVNRACDDAEHPVNREIDERFDAYDRHHSMMYDYHEQWPPRAYTFELPQTPIDAVVQMSFAESGFYAARSPDPKPVLIAYRCNPDVEHRSPVHHAWRVVKRCLTLTMDAELTREPLKRRLTVYNARTV